MLEMVFMYFTAASDEEEIIKQVLNLSKRPEKR
jgi:hypothetical protein